MDRDYLVTRLSYDKETGIFYWKTKAGPYSRVRVGDIAGSINFYGYRKIILKKKAQCAHKLAWLYVYGEWPTMQIDHINGNRDDNRISNLRHVTNRQNAQNRSIRRNGKSPGCSYNKKRKQWQAYITINGKMRHLGWFSTQTDASKAYWCKASQQK